DMYKICKRVARCAVGVTGKFHVEVINEVYPMGTYGNLAAQVPVFLLTDWLRYNDVVIFQCVAIFISTAISRWSTSVPEMQASEFIFGVASACEVAYYSYIYSSNIWVNYATWIIFKCVYMALMTLAMFHIATGLTMERYALVFGANYFAAGVFQAVFVSIVVSDRGLGLGIIRSGR
ncbi:unnamed protein product, partial [Tetraodon nigroviridis]